MRSQHAKRITSFLRRAKSDSLVRNSVYLMASTVVTAGLGYLFWVVAAHAFTSQEVGIGSAIISLCGTVALLTYLGSGAMLIERLPTSERSSEWTDVLVRICVGTAGVTVVATAVIVPILRISHEYRMFFSTVLAILIAMVGAAAWTLVNLFGSAFIAARRAGLLLLTQTLVSATKLLLVLPFAAFGAGAAGLVGAWVASAAVGVGVGAVWLIPRMRLGRQPGPRPRRRATVTSDRRLGVRRRARHRRPSAPPSASSVRRLLGQHLTSVGGAVTPLLLPVLVVLRLGATPNAYFYITWMVGGVFFMVSPSVSSALFAEGVRAGSDLRSVVAKALRVIVVLLAPAIVVMIVGGRLILGLFGASYATAGYGLLVLLAISALPDTVSNVAVVVLRVTDRLGYSTVLNLGILVVTLAAAWILLPSLGIAGAGVAWLGAQILGATACLPAYAKIFRRSEPGGVQTRMHANPEWGQTTLPLPAYTQIRRLPQPSGARTPRQPAPEPRRTMPPAPARTQADRRPPEPSGARTPRQPAPEPRRTMPPAPARTQADRRPPEPSGARTPRQPAPEPNGMTAPDEFGPYAVPRKPY
jgi:O-antigen/teichoic acid export membrane protein